MAAVAALVIGSAAVADPGKSQRPVCPGFSAGDTARCNAHVVTDQAGKPLAATSPTGLTPTQLRTAYSLSGGGSTRTIAIVDAYNDPTAESDLAHYSSQWSLPQCTTANGCFKKVNQRGSSSSFPKADSGWALEISLDLQAAHAACPNCKLLLVEADSPSFVNLGTAVNRAATMGAAVISNSYGAAEFSSEQSYDSYYTHSGIAITASSGDNGYGVEYPAASSKVIAVGGTTLTLNADGTRAGETAWSGAGSGCSAYVPKPAWQTDSGCARRAVADVSAVADPNTGLAVYDTTRYQGRSGWFQVGGTSLASPVVAAIYARGTSTNSASFPYASGAPIFDVTSGSNGSCGGSYLCTAGSGFDGPTGVGAPNGTF
jgi:subtilase family serine protease